MTLTAGTRLRQESAVILIALEREHLEFHELARRAVPELARPFEEHAEIHSLRACRCPVTEDP